MKAFIGQEVVHGREHETLSEALRRSPFLDRKVRARIRGYQRPGFHPDDFDATETLTHRRAELFGPGGALLDRLA